MRAKLKRVLIYVSLFVLVFCNNSYAQTFNDVQGTSFEEAANVLNGLGIMSAEKDGNFNPEKTITRAEFATIVSKLMGLSDVNTSGSGNLFKDVTADNPAAAAISNVTKLNIISGYGDGKFGPNDPVTYEQAVKVMVNVLGYTILAEQKGGFPSGYLAEAAEKGITKNVDNAVGSKINKGTLAQIIYDSLDIEIMEETGFGNDTKYTYSPDKTLLSEKLKIFKNNGKVVATGDTSMFDSNSTVSDDSVQIDRDIFKIGNTNAKDYLGYLVTYYYKQDTEKNENDLVYIESQTGKNNVITVSADNIDSSTTKEKFEYWVDKDTDSEVHELTISSTADLIINGKTAAISDSNIQPECGQVKLIDTDMDGIYDEIFVTKYDTLVVDRVSPTDYKVYDKYNVYSDPNSDTSSTSSGQIVFDPSDSSKIISITKKDGTVVKLTDLQEWDVLNIANSSSQGKNLVKVTVLEDTIDGSVDEINSDGTIIIGGKEYKKSQYYINAITSRTATELKIGDQATFYLDIDGKIAAAKINASSSENIAYLKNVGTTTGVDSRAQFRLLNSDGSWVTLDGADKIEFYDGISSDPNLDLVDSSKVANSVKINGVGQLVTYDLNSKGEISKLKVAELLNGDAYSETETVQNQDLLHAITDDTFRKTDAMKSAAYTSSNQAFSKDYTSNAPTIFCNDSTYVFVYPDPNDPNKSDNEDLYSVKNVKYFVNAVSYSNVTSYNENEFHVSGALTVQSQGSTAEIQQQPIFVVDHITTVINDKGVQAYKLYGASVGNADFSAITADTSVGGDLHPGDIISYLTNSNNEITAIYPCYDIKSGNIGTGTVDGNFSYLMAYMHGVVRKVSIKDKIMLMDDSVGVIGGWHYYNLSPASKFYLYDDTKPNQTNKIQLSSVNDIREGDIVFVDSVWGVVQDVVIIRHNW